MTRALALCFVLVLSACADGGPPLLQRFQGGAPDAEPGTEAVAGAPLTAPRREGLPALEATTAEDFDTTTPEERAEAAAVAETAAARQIGRTVASLGDPSDAGFWIETPLVSETMQGRLDDPANGKSVQVELRPSGGAAGSGSRVSLPAMRVLDAPLTGLPELIVFAL